MRLAINGRFYGARVTGVQRVARELCARLYDEADVTLFLPRGTHADVPAHVRVVRGLFAGQLWEQLELPLRLQRSRHDVMLQLSGPAPLWLRGHVLLVHDVLPLTQPHWFAPRFAAWYRFALSRSARRAAVVLTVSDWAKREIETCLDITGTRVRVMTQGLKPFDRPASPEEIERVRVKWSLPDRYLLATGGGDPRKNAVFLERMLFEWDERDSSTPHLVIVGGNDVHVHSSPSSAGVHPRVQYVGHVTDAELHALYSGADVFCFPSLAEGFGRPPLEALASGTPCIVSPYDAAFEVLGGAAEVLPLNTDMWISALMRLLDDSAERAEMVARGRQVASRYQWGRATQQLLDACASAVPDAVVRAQAAGF